MLSPTNLNKNSNTKQNTKSAQRSQKYQFVGVCDETGAGRTKWYARPRPSGPKSSFLVRMIRLDKKALLRDMLLSREVDVYVEYENSGKVDGSNGRFLVEPKYSVKSRSLTNMWNFNPLTSLKNLSGNMSGRERRIKSGVYTDGSTVYVSRYDYRSGKNGMLPVGDLIDLVKRGKIGRKEKERLIKRVKEGTPDVVREEVQGEE
ncbi:hypothetical protein TrRE_jg7219 [Triparma retinervis]|uniref:Uncharacterized protein n=1 Tax=Triparma retinervis TaxID=2557542 RepID=A0A9W7AR77_9STRA|nr:hypothetical protein TrRE_jg7219 [Triparma retinervis]